MDKKKDIYWQGMIYVGYECDHAFGTGRDFTEYLNTLPSYPVHGNHSFTDGQTVVEGKDYSVKQDMAFGLGEPPEIYAVAIPLSSASEQGEKQTNWDADKNPLYKALQEICFLFPEYHKAKEIATKAMAAYKYPSLTGKVTLDSTPPPAANPLHQGWKDKLLSRIMNWDADRTKSNYDKIENLIESLITHQGERERGWTINNQEQVKTGSEVIKSKEEIYQSYVCNVCQQNDYTYTDAAIEAMEEYASQFTTPTKEAGTISNISQQGEQC